MSKTEKLNEDQVFRQEVADDELKAVGGVDTSSAFSEDNPNNCSGTWLRNIYGGNGFPNCAATVEDKSWCSDNDACYADAVYYFGMYKCTKAWE